MPSCVCLLMFFLLFFLWLSRCHPLRWGEGSCSACAVSLMMIKQYFRSTEQPMWKKHWRPELKRDRREASCALRTEPSLHDLLMSCGFLPPILCLQNKHGGWVLGPDFGASCVSTYCSTTLSQCRVKVSFPRSSRQARGECDARIS